MFGIGFLELCIILIGGLLLFGPQKAPELMRKLGQFLFQVRKLSNEVRSSMQDAMETKEELTNTVVQKKSADMSKKDKEDKLEAISWQASGKK